MSHSRRRSRSSSSSPSSPSSSDEGHSKGHKDRASKHGSGRPQPSVPGVPQGIAAGFGGHNLYSNVHQGRAAAQMSGPGFPSSPPPYGAPSYEGQGYMSMPGASAESHYAPPLGPPPGFPSAHGPGFPSAEHEKAGYNDAGSPGAPSFPTSPSDAPGFPSVPFGVGATTENREGGFHAPGHRDDAPPKATPPPSGYRIPLAANQPFPPAAQTAQPVANDLDGSPVFMGSALLDRSVHPCKIVPNLQPPCRVPYGGGEFEHSGRYDLLPFDPAMMEWVPTAQGRIPPGRRPVEGGYEENGGKLYHALGEVQGVRVPGKTGEHLGGANLAFGGGEHVVREYAILCWR